MSLESFLVIVTTAATTHQYILHLPGKPQHEKTRAAAILLGGIISCQSRQVSTNTTILDTLLCHVVRESAPPPPPRAAGRETCR